MRWNLSTAVVYTPVSLMRLVILFFYKKQMLVGMLTSKQMKGTEVGCLCLPKRRAFPERWSDAIDFIDSYKLIASRKVNNKRHDNGKAPLGLVRCAGVANQCHGTVKASSARACPHLHTIKGAIRTFNMCQKSFSHRSIGSDRI